MIHRAVHLVSIIHQVWLSRTAKIGVADCSSYSASHIGWVRLGGLQRFNGQHFAAAGFRLGQISQEKVSSEGMDELQRTLRGQMPITGRWAYFDHAAVAPLSGPAANAMGTWAEQAAAEGDTVWPDWAKRVEQVRETAAGMIHARPSEVAIVPNTTAGIGLVAEGFPWKSGDNVVTLSNEFPSNLYPWMNLAQRGVETRAVESADGRVDVEQLLEAMDGRTRLVSVSWVGYASGWRIDLEEFVQRAHQRGVLVFLDAIQGLGVFPLDVRRTPVDFLAADGHKWMLGPEGAGIFYLREEHLDLLRPIGVGWNSVVHAHDFARVELDLRREAARYEGGSQNMIGTIGFGASLDLLVSLGVSPDRSPVAEQILATCANSAELLKGIGAKIVSHPDTNHASGIVSFEIPGCDPAHVRRRCLAAGVALSCRAGRLRISPHAYVDQQDIQRMVDAVRDASDGAH